MIAQIIVYGKTSTNLYIYLMATALLRGYLGKLGNASLECEVLLLLMTVFGGTVPKIDLVKMRL